VFPPNLLPAVPSWLFAVCWLHAKHKVPRPRNTIRFAARFTPLGMTMQGIVQKVLSSRARTPVHDVNEHRSRGTLCFCRRRIRCRSAFFAFRGVPGDAKHKVPRLRNTIRVPARFTPLGMTTHGNGAKKLCHPERGCLFTLVNERRSRGTFCFCREPIRCQILPMRILSHDQPPFLFAAPAFQLLLAIDRIRHVIETLPVDQASAVVIVAESFANAVLMLPDAFAKIAGHADLQTVA
jgi:hypothetical protein